MQDAQPPVSHRHCAFCIAHDSTARGKSLAAFDARRIIIPSQRGCRIGDPGARCAAPPSNIPYMLRRPSSFAGPSRELRRDLAEALAEAGRALPSRRLTRLGATPAFHRGLSSPAAYTLLELLFAVTFSLTLGAVATPQLLASVDEQRAAGAVRYIATKLQQSRMEAAARSASVGWQFVSTTNGYTYAPYLDGNGNGIRSRDIQDGIDPEIGPLERLPNHFAGVDFGVLPGLPPVDPGGTAPGTDPIKLGSGNILTFTPLGTSSSGSLYLRGRRNAQYVIRILGETGKTRVLKFDPNVRQWKPA